MTTVKRNLRPGAAPALARGLEILNFLAARDGEASFTELHRHLEVTKSTVSRLLGELIARNYVAKSSDNHRYRLGNQLLALGYIAGEGMELRREAHPFLIELAEGCKESVELTVLDGEEILCILKVDSPQAVILRMVAGIRYPINTSAIGKVWLAHMSDGAFADHLGTHGLERRTERTETDPARLREMFRRLFRDGYTTDVQEWRPGVVRVAAPVYDHRRQIVGALSVAAPDFRITETMLHGLGAMTRGAALRICRHLGFIGDYPVPPDVTGEDDVHEDQDASGRHDPI